MIKRLLPMFPAGVLSVLYGYVFSVQMLDIQAYRSFMQKQPLPDVALTVLLILVPVTEVAILVLLCLPTRRCLGMVMSAILWGVRATYILLLLTGVLGVIPCVCGGLYPALGWHGHLVFSYITALLSVVGYRICDQA